MVKYLIIVLAVALSIFLAFHCEIFKTGSNRGSSCRPENEPFPESRHETVYSCPNCDFAESSDEQSRTPLSINSAASTGHRCIARNIEAPRAQEAGPFERLSSRFGFGNSASNSNSNNCRAPVGQVNPCNTPIELSENEPDFQRGPRAASTRLASANTSPQQQCLSCISMNDGESYRRPTVGDIEKCCNIFFCDPQKNAINPRDAGARTDVARLQELPKPPCQGPIILFLKASWVLL